ncbi:uncharacterized protein LOC143859496 [Tasmannia lanceolata]|uniref:uncharacterized protein LOC143859496 n=1 Tax=Tasmannia lanceolata TaxID=3420 RepID=UPI004063E769
MVSKDPPSAGSEEEPKQVSTEEVTSPPKKDYIPKAPFPRGLANNKKLDKIDKVLNVFKQVHVNIPLLDAISQVPTYAKVLKDLCTQKRTTYVLKKPFLAANVSSILSHQMVAKYKDRIRRPQTCHCHLQLADRSVKTPKGMVEDVLVKIGDFLFPMDFVVLDMEPVVNNKDQISIILGFQNCLEELGDDGGSDFFANA